MLILLLVIYLSLLCFRSYSFSKRRKQQIKKKPADQNFVILFFCFCLKQGRSVGPANQKTNLFSPLKKYLLGTPFCKSKFVQLIKFPTTVSGQYISCNLYICIKHRNNFDVNLSDYLNLRLGFLPEILMLENLDYL